MANMTPRQLRKEWRREVRRTKRLPCTRCGYPARMHSKERVVRNWAGPAWRTVDPDHDFEEGALVIAFEEGAS